MQLLVFTWVVLYTSWSFAAFRLHCACCFDVVDLYDVLAKCEKVSTLC